MELCSFLSLFFDTEKPHFHLFKMDLEKLTVTQPEAKETGGGRESKKGGKSGERDEGGGKEGKERGESEEKGERDEGEIDEGRGGERDEGWGGGERDEGERDESREGGGEEEGGEKREQERERIEGRQGLREGGEGEREDGEVGEREGKDREERLLVAKEVSEWSLVLPRRTCKLRRFATVFPNLNSELLTPEGRDTGSAGRRWE